MPAFIFSQPIYRKTRLIMSIASEITRLQQAKNNIKMAIQDKGVIVPSSTKLDDYYDYIAQIPSGGATSFTRNNGDILWSDNGSYQNGQNGETIPESDLTMNGNLTVDENGGNYQVVQFTVNGHIITLNLEISVEQGFL